MLKFDEFDKDIIFRIFINEPEVNAIVKASGEMPVDVDKIKSRAVFTRVLG